MRVKSEGKNRMILEELAALARARAAEEKKKIPAGEMRRMAEYLPVTGAFPFEEALRAQACPLFVR